MQAHPLSPLEHIPWIAWIERTEIPAPILGILAGLIFLPFYDFESMPPQAPLGAGAFPVALAVYLMFIVYLTRGATSDLGILVRSNKIQADEISRLGPSAKAAIVELLCGLIIGIQRVTSQINFSHKSLSGFIDSAQWQTFEFWIIIGCILVYSIIQIHLLMYCFRQIRVFNRVARSFPVDLLSPDLNNVMSNPLIRFILVALFAASFALLVYEVVPYASMQRRLIAAGYVSGVFWVIIVVFSSLPLFRLKARISIAKKLELDVVRRAIKGDASGLADSQIGEKLVDFTLPDLLYYEDRIKAVWDWPFEAQVRRLVIFGLIPPLTWVLAALVELTFENVVFN